MTKNYYKSLVNFLLNPVDALVLQDAEPASQYYLSVFRLASEAIADRFTKSPSDEEMENFLFNSPSAMIDSISRLAAHMPDDEQTRTYFFHDKRFGIPSKNLSLPEIRTKVTQYCLDCLNTDNDVFGFEWSFDSHRQFGESKAEFKARYESTPKVERFTKFINEYYQILKLAAKKADIVFDEQESKEEKIEKFFSLLISSKLLIKHDEGKYKNLYSTCKFLDYTSFVSLLPDGVDIHDVYNQLKDQLSYNSFNSFKNTMTNRADYPEGLLVSNFRKQYKQLQERETKLEKECPPDNADVHELEIFQKAEQQFFKDRHQLYADIEKNGVPRILIFTE